LVINFANVTAIVHTYIRFIFNFA